MKRSEISIIKKPDQKQRAVPVISLKLSPKVFKAAEKLLAPNKQLQSEPSPIKPDTSIESLIRKLQQEGCVSNQFASYGCQEQFQILWQKQQIEENEQVRGTLTDAINHISKEISRNKCSPIKDVYYTKKVVAKRPKVE